MYIVIIGWMYVAVMMAVAEATASNGSLLGAAVTFVLYGLLPAALMAYILGTPARKAKRRQEEMAAQADDAQSQQAADAMPETPTAHESPPNTHQASATPTLLDSNTSGHAPGRPQD